MASFEDYKCILCYKIPSNKNDINFLDGKNNIRAEIDDLPFVGFVLLSSESANSSICKICLSLLYKRRGLKQRLADISNTIATTFQTASSAIDIGISSKANAAKKLTYEEPSGQQTSLRNPRESSEADELRLLHRSVRQ